MNLFKGVHVHEWHTVDTPGLRLCLCGAVMGTTGQLPEPFIREFQDAPAPEGHEPEGEQEQSPPT